MSTPTTIGVDDNFSTRDSSVTLRSTDYKATRRLDVINSAFVKEVLRDHLSDDLFHYLLTKGVCSDFLGVLSRDNDGVNSERDKMTRRVLAIFNCNLGF